jgi:hypothetical protein
MRTLGAARCGAKAGRRPKNGLLALKPRIHASPESSPFPPHARARSEIIYFAWICGPGAPLGAARGGAKVGSGPKNGPLALNPRIHALPLHSPCPPQARAPSELCVFSLYLRAQRTRWALPGRRAKAGSGPKNGLLVLTLRVHASPALSPSLSYMRVRSDSLCFGAGDHGCTGVYIRVHP